jgi:hypothetical protein
MTKSDDETLRPEDQKNLESVTVAANWLRQKGFKVSRAKAFRDAKTGLLVVEPNGSVKRENAMTYALGLNFKGTSTPDLNVYTQEKAALEAEKIRLQNEKMRWEMEREQGKFMEKDKFALEMASRGAVLETGLKNLFHTRAPEWIRLVGGKDEKSNLLLTILEKELDELMNDYSNMTRFQIDFVS